MIQVNAVSNFNKKSVLVPETTTIREVLEQTGIGFSAGSTNIDGTPITLNDLDKTLSDYGVTESCRVFNVQKADNA